MPTGMSTSLSLKMAGLDAPVSSLSGGNAQKVVIGKWLLRDPHLLMLDDPTKGIDVGAKAEFYKLLAQLCDEGKSVLLYSSDDEELIGLCDRVLVMHDGMIRSGAGRRHRSPSPTWSPPASARHAGGRGV